MSEHASAQASPSQASPSVQAGALSEILTRFTAILPGLALVTLIALAASWLSRQLPPQAAISPLILAIMLGIAVRNLAGTPQRCRAGIGFSLRRLLRLAIILLGLQLTVGQLVTVGGKGLLITATALAATFLFTTWLGRKIGVERQLAQLIAAGTSICGASAVVAANTVTQAPDEDVAYAIACVTVFGTLAVVLDPSLGLLLHLPAQSYGLWTGASIHEIAQVVAAAFQRGDEAGHVGTIAKLSRVAMLAPVVLSLGALASRRSRKNAGDAPASAKVPLPWFVFGFIAMALFNSLDVLPAAAKADLTLTATFLLTLALAAMGLETDIGKLKAKGLRPLLLGAAAAIFIGTVSLALIELAY
ncbi:MAG TPA: YeiH family protein [Ferrovibrio sp.]|uniref:YeiH family protein n=1 Tax=Ferrovibrio sp. TaxID=1917215 RepID=UPI002ED030BF